MAEQQILSGARCKVAINGVTIGFATGINWTRSAGTKPIYELDNQFIVDQIDTVYAVRGTLTGFRVVGSGNLESQGIMGLDDIKNLFRRNYVSIQIIDRKTGDTIGNITSVMFDNDSWSMGARTIVGFNVQFVGKMITSERS